MLNVQKYLIDNGVDSLKDNYGVIVKEYPYFNVYNYSQINSPKNDPITKECRGLILANDEKFSVLCRSFDRFYNLGEADQKVDNIDNYTILEKYDGSLINVWYNNFEEKWQASTRGTAYAESETPYGNKFIDIIENKILGYSIDGYFERFVNYRENLTYIFELIGPENRVVKPYKKPQLVLIGIRNRENGEYFTYDQMIFFHCFQMVYNEDIELAQKYQFSSIDDIMKNLGEIDAMDEGYVLWNEKTGHRVKIKNPDYVAIHHLRNNGVLAPRNIVHLINANEHEEYLSYFEEDREFFVPYINAYNKLREEVDRLWDNTKGIEDQKKFALQVKDTPYASILFSLRKGFTIKECFDRMNIKKLTEIVEKIKEK